MSMAALMANAKEEFSVSIRGVERLTIIIVAFLHRSLEEE